MLATFINVIKTSITYNVTANGYNQTGFKNGRNGHIKFNNFAES